MKRTSVLLLALAGCGYGLMAPLVRIANSIVPPFTSVVVRYSLVSFVLLVVIALRREFHLIAPRSRYDAVFIVLVGLVGAGLSNVVFSLSVLTTSIGHAVFLFSLYAVFTPLLSGIILLQWPTRGQWAALASAIIGMALLTGVFTISSMAVKLGDVFAVAGALIVSLQYVGTRVMRSRSAAIISLYLAAGSILAALPGAIIVEWLGHSPEAVFGVEIRRADYPLWLGIVSVLAFGAMNLLVNLLVSQGFRLVRASYGSVLLLLEPVVGMVVGIIFFGESPRSIALVGACLILVGGVASVWIQSVRERSSSVAGMSSSRIPLLNLSGWPVLSHLRRDPVKRTTLR